jgi:hypothetical protein
VFELNFKKKVRIYEENEHGEIYFRDPLDRYIKHTVVINYPWSRFLTA